MARAYSVLHQSHRVHVNGMAVPLRVKWKMAPPIIRVPLFDDATHSKAIWSNAKRTLYEDCHRQHRSSVSREKKAKQENRLWRKTFRCRLYSIFQFTIIVKYWTLCTALAFCLCLTRTLPLAHSSFLSLTLNWIVNSFVNVKLISATRYSCQIKINIEVPVCASILDRFELIKCTRTLYNPYNHFKIGCTWRVLQSKQVNVERTNSVKIVDFSFSYRCS